jgi:hypothetical protein
MVGISVVSNAIVVEVVRDYWLLSYCYHVSCFPDHSLLVIMVIKFVVDKNIVIIVLWIIRTSLTPIIAVPLTAMERMCAWVVRHVRIEDFVSYI